MIKPIRPIILDAFIPLIFWVLILFSCLAISQESPTPWQQAFTPEHKERLLQRGIELPSGKKGVTAKQLPDFLTPTQLEMLRSRKAELQYQEQSPQEVYEKYQYITPQMGINHVKKAIAHINQVGIQQAIKDFNQFPSIWYKGRKELMIGVWNCTTWTVEAFPAPAMGIKEIIGVPGVAKRYKDRKGRYGGLLRCMKYMKKHPKGYFFPVYHTFMASHFVMDFVTFDIPYTAPDGQRYFVYTQLAYEIKSMQEAEALTKRYENGEFD